jgi:hypothetical protein
LFVADQKSTLISTSAFCLQWSNLPEGFFFFSSFYQKRQVCSLPLRYIYIYIYIHIHAIAWMDSTCSRTWQFCHHCDHLQSHCFLSSFDLLLAHLRELKMGV